MSLESYLQAIPKVDVGLTFEGAIPTKDLIMIAEQNDQQLVKGYREAVAQLEKPEHGRIPRMIPLVSQWALYPDNLTRLAYQLGVALSRQNVRYAEISVNPLRYLSSMGFDKFIEALNDGADRAYRGWNVQLAWILTIPRDEPRRADEVSRYALSATGRKNRVVAIGLAGAEDAQPVSQFERTFRNVEKKDFPRVVQAGESLGTAGLIDALKYLRPTRVMGAWGLTEGDALPTLREVGSEVCLYLTREVRAGRIEDYTGYPLRALVDSGINLSLSAGMPTYYRTTLTDEYRHAIEGCGLSLEQLEALALNAIRQTFLPEDQQKAMLEEFTEAYAQLRAEHLDLEAH